MSAPKVSLQEEEQPEVKVLTKAEQKALNRIAAAQKKAANKHAEDLKKLQNKLTQKQKKIEQDLQKRKEKREKNAKSTRNQLAPKIKQMALNTSQIELTNEDIKVPASAKEKNLPLLYEYAVKKYYKRTKENTPFQLQVKEEARKKSLLPYVKFTKKKTSLTTLLAEAQKRKNKTEKKNVKSHLKQEIEAYARDTHNLDEKGLRSVICYKPKTKKKKNGSGSK
jgi:hypothetical protein